MAGILSSIVTVLLIALYVPALILLFVYSANLYYMTILALWRRKQRPGSVTLTELPVITVQLPLYNERFVSQRIIDAAAKLDWPADKLEIQVLDDSTDETAQLVADRVQHWLEQGVNIAHIRRPDRTGYKAGALAYGLEFAKGEYIAIFDADFVPGPAFLKDMLPAIVNDPGAAFVQARWEHLNRHESWLTEIQAIAIDGHFGIEQQARCFGGFAFNFNGTAGIWRRTAIVNAGGWKATTLTEDLDLSYRTWLKGWRGLYQMNVDAPAELPPTMPAFKRQQARWAQGSIESARMLLGPVWRSNYTGFVKLQATIHLLGYLINPIMAMLAITYPIMLLMIERFPQSESAFKIYSSLGPLTFAPTVFFVVSQLLLNRNWKLIPSVLLFQIISTGLAMNTMRATLKAFVGQRGEFLRTPKWGNGNATIAKGQYRVKADIGVMTDLVWALLCFLIVILSYREGHIFMTLYALISALGALWVGLWTLWPDLVGWLFPPQPVLQSNAQGV